MSEQQTKTDLIRYLKNSILAKVKQLARFPDTISSILLDHLYKDIVQKTTTEEVLNQLMYEIFEFKKEESSEFYAFVEAQKQLYKTFWQNPEEFYGNEQAQAVFKMNITDKEEPACSVKELLQVLDGQPVFVKLEHKALIEKKYDKAYRKLFAISVREYSNLSELLRHLCDFGSINAAFVHGKQTIVQFCGYESILAISYKLEEIQMQLGVTTLEVFSIYQSKGLASDNEATPAVAAPTDTRVAESAILINLPEEYRKDGIFAYSAINFKFVKAVYAIDEDDSQSIVLQFVTPNSCAFFMKHFSSADGVKCSAFHEGEAKLIRILRQDEKDDEM